MTPARMSSRLPISIHALLAESDWQAGAMQLPTAPFLSTLSLRRATAAALLLGKNYVKFLSTLSLRRATYSVIFKISPLSNFYPRSPCGERQLTLVQGFLCWTFLSTLSLRRATCHHINKNAAIGFLSTLSLRRATDVPVMSLTEYGLFLSTLSLRRATRHLLHCLRNLLISIHALLAESDRSFFKRLFGIHISIHALLAESDKLRNPIRPGKINFYPRSPCGERQALPFPLSL